MSEKPKAVLIRVNILGFAGEPATIFGAFDPATEVLAIARIAPEYEPGPRDGFVKITNQERDAGHDLLFSEADLRDAIQAFFELDALKLVNLGAHAGRISPANRIERKGLGDTGVDYNIHPDTSNLQVAVLAAALFSSRQRGVRNALEFMDDLITI